jgi:hypothetical protein
MASTYRLIFTSKVLSHSPPSSSLFAIIYELSDCFLIIFPNINKGKQPRFVSQENLVQNGF